jgi:hypothetical protein
MADTITTNGNIVTAWTDAAEALLPSTATNINRLVALPAIQPSSRTITNTNGVNLTLSSALGLYPGSRVQLVVSAGTIPAEATPGYVFQIKTVAGNIVTVAHDILAPAIDWGLGVTATWAVVLEEITVVSPVAQWDYYAYPLRDVALALNTKYLNIARNKVNTAVKTYDINYSRSSFRRSSAAGTAATFTIKHLGIVEVNNATTPTAITSVTHHITLENPVVLTTTLTTSINISLTSGFVLT